MACNYTVDLSTLSGTASRYSTNWSISSSFISLAGQNGKEIRSIKIRTGGAQAGDLQFLYFVVWKTVTIIVDYYEVLAVSGPHTIASGSAGILTYPITPILLPSNGRTYYGMIQQGVAGALRYDFLWPNNGMAGGVDLNTSFSSFVTAGTSLSFSPAWNNTSYVLALAEEVCDVSTPLIFTASELSATHSIVIPTITRGIPLTADNMATVAGVGGAPFTNGIPLASENLGVSTFIQDAAYVKEGDFIGDEMVFPVSVETATLTQTIPLTPSSLTAETTLSQASVNREITLTAENLSMLPAVQSAVNFSLSTMGLSSNSSRTPDAGITLDWEESGVPKAYSWYDKVLYRFHLEFDQITEDQCLLLEDFCETHRYDEIDYQWPFDSHTYRCVLIEDVKERIIRSDTALGVRCSASVELLGYEVA